MSTPEQQQTPSNDAPSSIKQRLHLIRLSARLRGVSVRNDYRAELGCDGCRYQANGASYYGTCCRSWQAGVCSVHGVELFPREVKNEHQKT